MTREEVVGFVGLGAMGAPIVRRLLLTTPVAVFDVRQAAVDELAGVGAIPCATPSQVGDAARVVFTSLPTPEAAQAVIDGPGSLLEGERLATLVELSTVGPATAASVARQLAEHSVSYLDAPVSGGVRGAEAGELTIMASGPEDLFQQTLPLLEAFGSRIFLVGDEPGHGQLTKLLNNFLSATALVATSEALTLATKSGLDPARLLEAINASSGRNSATSDKFPRCVLTREFDFGFRLALMEKDVRLCVEEALRSHSPALVASLVGQLLSVAEREEPPGADCTALARAFERWGSVEFGSVQHGA